MEKTKSVRNPFPWIWKVFKYEMKNSARILLPLYVTTLIAAFLHSMFFIDKIESDSVFGILEIFQILYYVILITSGVVTVVVLARRFKIGLLGDEGYLNLMLPVTIGEHLLGRILSVVVWIPVCLVTGFVSLLILSATKLVTSEIYYFDLWFSLAAIFITVVLFAYLVNAVGHLAKKHRTIVKVVTVTVILSATLRILVGVEDIVRNMVEFEFRFKYNSYIISLTLLVFSAIYGVVTYFILKHRLNLE
ncbi:hypothetical protein J5681_04165 [bacterium]|nr:hypothetical protein [bacterium]